MEDREFLTRRQNADSIDALVHAVAVLSNTDFTLQMGSGLLISLTNYTTGGAVADEFSIAAEDMEVIKLEIIASLRRSLELRRVLLVRDIADIDKALGR